MKILIFCVIFGFGLVIPQAHADGILGYATQNMIHTKLAAAQAKNRVKQQYQIAQEQLQFRYQGEVAQTENSYQTDLLRLNQQYSGKALSKQKENLKQQYNLKFKQISNEFGLRSKKLDFRLQASLQEISYRQKERRSRTITNGIAQATRGLFR